MMAGANASVVGILASALYHPVWTSAVHIPPDFAAALVAFVLLTVWKVSPWKVVLLTALGGIGLSLLQEIGWDSAGQNNFPSFLTQAVDTLATLETIMIVLLNHLG